MNYEINRSGEIYKVSVNDEYRMTGSWEEVIKFLTEEEKRRES